MDLPVVAMILKSGWMARILLIFLGVVSIITWAIIFNRLSFFATVGKGTANFKKRFAGLASIGDLTSQSQKIDDLSPVAIIGTAGAREYSRIIDDANRLSNVKDWSFFLENQFLLASEHLDTLLGSLSTKLDKGLIVLAIVSSVAPLLGLMGTVWGIMNSFFEIGNQGSASLPVVAPGIAEALITTILGLFVAIPALFFYNYFIHKVERVEDELDEFKSVILSRLKRETFEMLYGEKSPAGSGVR